MKFNSSILAVLPVSFLLSGCVAIKPEDLQSPKELTCTHLKEPLILTAAYGPFDVEWTIRLERGPYWSEKVDGQGTYYRAPPGGLSILNKDGNAFPGYGKALDGGFYIPVSVNEPVRLYRYFSTEAAQVQVPADGVDCSALRYIKDPATSKVSLLSYATAGGAGGLAGGLVGRSMSGASGMSYGQAAGTGAVGGAIGGAIVAAIINADVGKIVPAGPVLKDAEFMAKLRMLGASGVSVKEARAEGNDVGPQPTYPAKP